MTKFYYIAVLLAGCSVTLPGCNGKAVTGQPSQHLPPNTFSLESEDSHFCENRKAYTIAEYQRFSVLLKRQKPIPLSMSAELQKEYLSRGLPLTLAQEHLYGSGMAGKGLCQIVFDVLSNKKTMEEVSSFLMNHDLQWVHNQNDNRFYDESYRQLNGDAISYLAEIIFFWNQYDDAQWTNNEVISHANLLDLPQIGVNTKSRADAERLLLKLETRLYENFQNLSNFAKNTVARNIIDDNAKL